MREARTPPEPAPMVNRSKSYSPSPAAAPTLTLTSSPTPTPTAAPTMPPTMTTPPAAETLAMSAVFFAAEVGRAVQDQEQSLNASQVLAFAAAAAQRDVCLS